MNLHQPPSPHSPLPGPAPDSGGNSGLGIVGGCLVFALGVLGLFTLLVTGLITGLPGFIVGLFFAALTVPLAVSLILSLDRMEAEPPWMLALAFFWGATVAVLFSLITTSLQEAIVGQVLGDPKAASLIGSVVVAPFNEELSKGLMLCILFFWQKNEFDGIIDGIVYAAMVALGFAAVENVIYYGSATAKEGLEGAVTTFFLRGIISPFAHPLFTSMTGIGLGWARQSDKPAVKFLAPLLGLCLAMILHALWNLSASFGALFFVAYFLIMAPALLIVLVLVFFSSRGEGEVLRQHLWQDVQNGSLTPDEYGRLCSGTGRIAIIWRAFTAGGVGAWRTQGQFNQTVSKLAFHRRRVARGLVKNPAEAGAQETAYLLRLRELRTRLNS